MNYKKIIIIIILILFILLFSGYILIKNNNDNNNDIFNNTVNNGSNLSKNISSNINNTTNNSKDDSRDMEDNLSNSNSYSMNKYKYPKEKKSKAESDKQTEEEKILECVKKGVAWDDGHGGSTQDVRLGKPYKSKGGLWLVPAFDKKTGKFLGAVWVAPEGGFFGGVHSYSEYKNIISGKTTHKTDSNKTQKIIVTGKSNPNITNNLNSINDNPENINFDNEDSAIDLNPTLPIIESCDVSNSTT